MSLFGWLRKQTPTNWSPYKVGPFAGIRLEDGSEAEMTDLVMRRRLANGTWEYRRSTDEEAAEYFADQQW
jgi:hypothetical protein